MGNRLSKIYTRTGDKGTTGLGDGSRVDKDSLRVEAYGTTDELNSVIGMVLSEATVTEPVQGWLLEIQHDLFDIGAELCVPGHKVITEAFVQRLEQHIDAMNSELPYLKEFILPGGNRAATTCHLARTVCRRSERRVLSLSKAEPINEWGLKYLNRLSDFLFVAARVLARADGGEEVMWNRKRFES
ncbi:cob(I)yrinic acid a,c-diamide adenosyltransferase [Ketobacter alkanivorans]|uniref:Corrinoid adenosyltransferase n=1 Tax=Ketobacter alkanivorans TaxID=1917421 RepID=A0A2K9LRN9_9GAMM|nr:cob(I)yrinic acid a,c-diamide adenosyltransferase [Ketobacter alkanivorans]AUM14125.1 ATP:cob(I)alamin adenosyltransferase [Ketobacter alkanivorans]MCP5017711.1 cob(I)yrinic acid a,c-diamide adenosyltransferase [Ketobacter sp.]